MEKYGVDIFNIKEIICGDKYSAVLLKNGHIGVCANLMNRIDVGIEDLRDPDLERISHRIVLNAYFNGMLNSLNRYDGTGDIFDRVCFQDYENLVMIGLFKPLLEKFRRQNIEIQVFDPIKENSVLVSESKKSESVGKADGMILSATSIANNTFSEMVQGAESGCDIFLLGPSSILDGDMFGYKKIKGIFGTIFKPDDQRVLDVIGSGYGTRKFLPLAQKVYLM